MALNGHLPMEYHEQYDQNNIIKWFHTLSACISLWLLPNRNTARSLVRSDNVL